MSRRQRCAVARWIRCSAICGTLLNPILQIGVFWVIFGLVLDTSRGVENFVAFLSIGIFTYQYSPAVHDGSELVRFARITAS